MSASLRPIVESDMPELVDLWVESWRDTMPAIDFEARRLAFTDLMQTHRQNGYRIEGLFIDGLQGFIAVHPKTGDLDQICVGVLAKGTSVALDLLNRAKDISPALLTLTVNAANPRAIRFYEREGFERTGEGINPQSGLAIHYYRWLPPSDISVAEKSTRR
jgi:putative acetyltransferase